MRKSIVIAFSFAALVFTANGASARLVQVGWVSESDLKKKCGANGGDWSSGEGGYSCGKKCDGGKDYCVYGCTKGQQNNSCTGSIPRTVPAPGKLTVEGVLNYVGGPPTAGPLDTTPGGSPQSPSGVGTPRPTTPPGGKLY